MATVTSLGFSLFARNGMRRGLNSASKDLDTFAARTIRKGREISEQMAPIAMAGGAAAAGTLAIGFRDALDISGAQNALTAQLNLTARDAGRAGDVAGSLWANNYGSSIEEVQGAIRGVGANITDLSELTNSEIESMSASALGLANIMGEDVSRVTRGVGQLLRNGLANDGQHAFDLITRAAQRLPQEMQGELLDTIEEYSADFSQLGLTGAQAMGMISASVAAGARNSDLAADAIREFSIRAIDGSTATADAFDALGMDADSMAQRIAAGGPAATAAMSEVIQAISGVSDPVAQEAIGVGLFGTRFEELGVKAIAALDPATAALVDVTGATEDANEAMRSSAAAQFRGVWRSITTVLNDELLPALSGLASWMTDNPRTVLALTAAAGGLVGTLLVIATVVGPLVTTVGLVTKAWQAWTAGSWALNASLLANPVTWIVVGIVALVAAVILAWKNFEGFRTAVTSTWATIRDGWSVLWDSYLKPGLDSLLAWWMSVWPQIQATAIQVWGTIQEYFAEIWPKIQEIFSQVSEIVMAFVYELQGVWSQHGGWITTVLVGIWSFVTGIFKGAFTLIISVVTAAWQIIGGVFSGALSVISGILNIFIGLFTGDWSRMWEGVKQVFSGLWTAVVGIFTGAVTLIKGILAALYQAIIQPIINLYMEIVGNSIIPDLVNGVISWFGRLRDMAAAIFAAVVNWIVSRVLNLHERVVTTIANLVAGFIARFVSLRDRARAIWDAIVTWHIVRIAYLRDRVATTVNNLKDRMISAFDRARAGIKKVWDKVESVAKKPIRFVIQTVFNKGIVGVWNKVADKVPGISTIREMRLPSGFDRGGILPGRSSWRGGDTHLRPMREGEGVYVSEAMRDPYERARLHAVNKAAMSGKSLEQFRDVPLAASPTQVAQGQPPLDAMQGYARGGIVGEWLSSKWDNIAGKVKDWATAPLNALRDRLKGDFGTGQDFEGIPYRMLASWRDKILDRFGRADEAHAASMAGGADSWVGLESASARLRRAATWARAQHGKPYIWGGAGPAGYDCSGFMGAIENKIRGVGPHFRRYSTHAFRGGSAPAGWQRNLNSPFTVGITHAGVGHTAGTLMGVNVESRGSVGAVVGSRARGTRDGLFTSRYGFAPVARDSVAGTGGGGGSATIFDRGGKVPPGLSVIDNRLGKPETLKRADYADEPRELHLHFHGTVTSRRHAEDMVVEALREAQRKGRVAKGTVKP
ncbi:phage tail tape measure protein [Nocardiopsis dassonvillei]|uniref:phage tail tape measure protein n=1 Tax=Nocardiopsis dassonvillei TaxID=2014 RepID=UPI0036FFF053